MSHNIIVVMVNILVCRYQGKSKLTRKSKFQFNLYLNLCSYMQFVLFQRNHSLFGTVMSTLTGTVKTSLPFTSRTQSLFVNHTQTHPTISPTNSFHGSHAKSSPQASINGKVSPADSGSRLNVELNNAINKSTLPSPLVSRMSPPDDLSRRSSHVRYGCCPVY